MHILRVYVVGVGLLVSGMMLISACSAHRAARLVMPIAGIILRWSSYRVPIHIHRVLLLLRELWRRARDRA
jgi:hypothetical protein